MGPRVGQWRAAALMDAKCQSYSPEELIDFLEALLSATESSIHPSTRACIDSFGHSYTQADLYL